MQGSQPSTEATHLHLSMSVGAFDPLQSSNVQKLEPLINAGATAKVLSPDICQRPASNPL